MRVFPDISVIWHVIMQLTPIADYKEGSAIISSGIRLGHTNMWSLKMKIPVGRRRRLKLITVYRNYSLEPGWGDAVKSAGIGRASRLKPAESKRRGIKERRKTTEPVLNTRESKEREICNPSHGGAKEGNGTSIRCTGVAGAGDM